MSKCSVVKCPVYTSDGEMVDLGRGVVAWIPLCSKHLPHATDAIELVDVSANDKPKRKLAL